MRHRLLTRLGLCPLALAALTLTACTEAPGSGMPSPTTAPSSAAPSAWNGFAAPEGLCAELDWSRLETIDGAPTPIAGSWTPGEGMRGIDCMPDVDSSRFKRVVGFVSVKVRLHDTAELATASLAAAGEEFDDEWMRLSPWTQGRLYENGVEVRFVGRAENLVVHVGITLEPDLAGVYGEERIADIATGLAQDAYGLCGIGS